jgi:hypothetical protein
MSKKSIRDRLTQIIDPEAAPSLLSIYYNDTQTDLVKMGRPDGTIYWVGTPHDSEGRPCRYSLVVEANGYMVGSAAINFITNRGWRRGNAKPDATTKSHVTNEFRRSFLQACLVHGGLEHDWSESLSEMLQEQTGIPVEPGQIDHDELMELTLLGVPHQHVRAAHSNGLHFKVNIPTLMSKRVSDGYAAVIPGDWDGESEEVAMTSNLTQAEVFLLRRKGLKFAKVAQLKRK